MEMQAYLHLDQRRVKNKHKTISPENSLSHASTYTFTLGHTLLLCMNQTLQDENLECFWIGRTERQLGEANPNFLLKNMIKLRPQIFPTKFQHDSQFFLKPLTTRRNKSL